MRINFKKILSYIFIAQVLYSTGLLAAHIIFAKSISGFWHGELLAHFWHYELALLPFLVALLLVRKFPKSAVGFLLVCGVIAVSLYKKSRPQGTLERAVSAVNKERLLQVICFNGNVKNTDKKSAVSWIMSRFDFAMPTIFVLIEASPDWQKELLILDKRLPHQKFQLSQDNFGIYTASNLRLDKMGVEAYTYGDIPAIQGEIEFLKRPFAFAAVHPFPPISNHWFNERESYLKGVKEFLAAKNLPSVVCGDFNTTAWTQSYERFRSAPIPLKDTFWGPLRPTTWGVTGLYTAIDFIFYSPDFELVYAEAGPKLGSDHKVLSALLRWK